MHRTQWYIGCSGFSYKEWKDIFYPNGLPQKNWFEYYARHFNTLELNVTFYRFPELKFLQSWYRKSPDDFVFSVKVPKVITHQKKLKDIAELLDQFYKVLKDGLAEKLGPILFQLPPSFQYSEEKLTTILNELHPSFTNVIEVRNSTWWRKEIMDELAKKNITFCGVSYPGLPDEVVGNTATSYYRFHGVPKLYHSSYENHFLDIIVQTIIEKECIEKVFLYFNNTASAAALANAKYVQQITKQGSFL